MSGQRGDFIRRSEPRAKIAPIIRYEYDGATRLAVVDCPYYHAEEDHPPLPPMRTGG